MISFIFNLVNLKLGMKVYLGKILTLSFAYTLFASIFTLGQKLAPGPQVLTFFSVSDDTEQPYGLYIPPNYDASKKYPLVMMLHGAGSNHRLDLRRVFGKSNLEGETDVEASRYFPKWDDVDFIVASPFARGTAGYQGIPEQDVYDVLADVKQRFNIDENRTYLTGLSMGGGGVLWLGLTRPDIWAAIAPVCPAPPAGTLDLAQNALNFPVHFFQGDLDPVVPVDGTRKWVSTMQDIGVEVTYKEFVDVKHDSWVSAYDAGYIFEWFKDIERIPYPNQVKFVSKLYKYNKAYWIELDKLVAGQSAQIHAKFQKENDLKIVTEKLEGFTLHLKGHPMFRPSENVSLIIDGKRLTAKGNENIHFVRNQTGWVETSGMAEKVLLTKRKGSEGPLFDVFSGRHIYVYGTADNPGAEELKKRIAEAQEAANWSVYRGEFLGRMMFFPRTISDKEVRPSDVESSNLVLFGSKESNSIIAQYAGKLPVALKPGVTNYGLLYVFPTEKHYLAISSGIPWWKGATDEGFPFVPAAFRKLPEYKDIVLFKDSGQNVIINEYMNQDWKLSDTQKASLVQSGAVIITQ
jgi:pimeloyl-ACP methyl ester carboxylesterase